MESQARDMDTNMLLGQDNKPVMEQMKIIIDMEEHGNEMEKQKIELRIKESEWQKFINYKQLLLGLILGQVDQTDKQQITGQPT